MTVINNLNPVDETDPTGKDQHEPGAKVDAGKNRVDLVLGAFSNALWAVAEVGTFGANKYTDDGWLEVPNAIARYSDAAYRHKLKVAMGNTIDPDSGLYERAHAVWNELAVLELELRALNENKD